MNLIKSSYYTLFATFIKLLTSLILNKAIAVLIGPKGLVFISQFQNFSQIAMISSQGGINNGVTKYVAEVSQSDELQLKKLISTSYRITFFATFFTSLIILFFSRNASVYFLNSKDYTYVFLIFSVSIFFFSINSLILSILNGLHEIKSFALINIIQSITTLIVTLVLVFYKGLDGILMALVTNQSVVFIVLVIVFRKHRILNSLLEFKFFNKEYFLKLAKYSLMTVITAIITPVSFLIIRNNIISQCGIDTAGIWQATWYISSMHLMVITTTLSAYYLPKLSSLKEDDLLRKEIFYGYKIIIPFVIFSSAGIFLLKNILIEILFTESFRQIKDLLLLQLIGDIIKMASWLLSYVMIAKAMTRVFIISELLFVSFFILCSFVFVSYFGIIGMTYAYIINYVVYFIFLAFIFRKLLFKNRYALQ